MFGYSYKQPLKAEALVTTAAGTIGLVALMSTLSCAIGIGIGGQNSHGDWTYYYKQMGDYVTNKFKAAGKTIADTGVLDFINDQANGYKTYHVSDDLMKATYEGFVAAFPPGTTLGALASNEAFVSAMKWTSTYNPNTAVYSAWCKNLQFISRFSNYVLVNTYTKASLPLNRYDLNFQMIPDSTSGTTFKIESDNGYYFSQHFDSVEYRDKYLYGSVVQNDVQWAELTASDSANGNDVWMLIDNYGDTAYVGYKKAGSTSPGTTSVPTDVPYVPGDKGLYAQGHSVLNNSYDDVMQKIKAAQGTLDGINVRISDAVGSLQQINDQVKAQTQSQVLGQSIADTAADTAADAATNAGRDVSIPKIPTMPDLALPTGLQKKFPFCLPWDLAACYRLFQVSPKAPVWTIPVNINVGMVHIDKTYTYDLNSMGVLDQVLPVFKWFEDLLFVLGLIMITRKIMS